MDDNIRFENGKVLLQTNSFVSNYIPLGTIISYSSNITSPLLGWLLCDGATISRLTYKNLFDVISIKWGEGDGSTTFHLPDLRGRFIRGRDRGQGNDPYSLSRISLNFGGSIGDNVGSYFQHTTALSTITAMSGSGTLYGSTSNTGAHTHPKDDDNFGVGGRMIAHDVEALGDTTPSGGHWHNAVASGSVSISGGDDETAPKNCYVEYLIKAY